MLATSNEIIAAWLNHSRQLSIRVKIDSVTYGSEEITSLSFDSGSISGEVFQIGSTYMNSVQIVFPSIIESIAEDIEVIPELGVMVNGSYEYTKLGHFFIDDFDRNKNNKTTSITATDKMRFMESEYVSKLTYPKAYREVALDVANSAGVEVNANSFASLGIGSINQPEGYTHRQAIGLIAQFEGGFASFNRNGELEIRRLAPTTFEITPESYLLKGFTKNEASYRIGGISVKTGEEETDVIRVGSTNGSQVELENKVMTQTLLNQMWELVKTLNYFPYELKWRGCPPLEAGDWIYVSDKDGNKYSVPNLSYSITFNGGMSAESKALTSSTSQATYKYRGSLNQRIDYLDSVLSANKWNTNYYGSETPENPKEGDIWFKPNGQDTEIWVYKNIDGVLKWVMEISSAGDPDLLKAIEDAKQAGQDAQAAGEAAQQAAEDAKQVGEAAKVAGTEAKAAAEDAGVAAEQAKVVGEAAQQAANDAKQAGDTAIALANQADIDAKAAKAKADAIQIDVNGLVSDVSTINVTATDAYNKAVAAGGAINELETTVDGQKQTIATAQSTASSALNKATIVETSVDGLRQTVASTTTTANSALTKATNVETTVNGLKTTVSSVETTANSALTKATSVEQTASGLTTKVTAVETTLENSGNPNILPYGGGNPTTINGWTAAAGLGLSTHVFYKTGMSNLYVLTNPNTTERTASSARFTVKPDTQYTFKFTGFAASNVSDMDVWWLSRAKGSTANYDRTKMLISARRLSPSKAEEVSVTFTTNAADSEGYIRFDNNGSNNGSNAQLFFIDVMMVEGPVAPKEWSPAYVELATSSQITQLSDQMNFKLTSSDGGVTQIDMQNKIVTIASENIYLTGKSYISDAVIKTAHIVDLAVSNGKIANLAVTEGKIGNLAVTNAKIASLAVTEGKIGDASITTAKIGNLAVSEAKIADLAVSSAKIANLAVTETKIGDAAITNAKIGNLAVSTAKIADAAITDAKIGNLSATKITTGTLNAANVNIINLNASSITTGTISGANLTINLATGAVLFSKGKIQNINETFYIDIDNDTYYSEGYTSSSQANKAMVVLRGGTVRAAIKQANATERIESMQIIGNSAIRTYVAKTATNSLDMTGELYNSELQTVTDMKLNYGSSSGTRYGNFSVELYQVANGGTASLSGMPAMSLTGATASFYLYAPSKIEMVTSETLTLTAKRTDINSGGDATSYGGLSLGNDSSGGRVWSIAIYNRTYAAGNGDICITSAGTLGRKTSARKYKADIKTADDVIAHAKEFLTIQPASWYDKKDYLNGIAEDRFYGFIADEFHEKGLTEVVYYGDKGQVEGLAYDRLTMYQNVILSEHEQEIQRLKIEVSNLKTKVEELEAA